ncbi:MAG: 3-deoxy-D-manno-octulosonic acid transferase [Tepidisphaeraceae bacterium]|jgi:3-deoxy-D-manno-octulosonic-acid transferase
MPNIYDIAYWSGLIVSSPYWLLTTSARQKVLKAFSQRSGRVPARDNAAPAVMIHAVSLGEMNATRGLVERLRVLRPDLDFIITSTTDTGLVRAQELYGLHPKPVEPPSPAPGLLDSEPEVSHFTLLRYPLDFTGAVTRLLDNLRPSAVVLMELEIWPNFLRQCEVRNIPVMVVNGRVTEPSFRKYRLVRAVTRKMFSRLSAACVQEQVYADRFRDLGLPAERIAVTGTMKFDTATVSSRVPGDELLCDELQIRPMCLFPQAPDAQRFWVCGSTGPGEEEIVLRQYRQLLARHARLRLAIVPRKPERFDEVAQLILDQRFQLVRRSKTVPATQKDQLLAFLSGSPAPQGEPPEPASTLLPPVILGDTMGELRKFYSLADVVFVGRSLVDLGARQHGSDMIEPAALGKPVITGPFTGNFADAMSRFRAADAMLEVSTAEELGQAVSILLSSPVRAAEMGSRAQAVVTGEKGATERHVRQILKLLPAAEQAG